MRESLPWRALVDRLDPATRRDAFEPAWHDALADHHERARGAGPVRRFASMLVLRARVLILLLQCLRLQRSLPAPEPSRRTGIMEGMARDFRFAARALRRHPGFAVLAALTLALGIGANTAIFSVVRAVLLRSLPYADADRLVVLWGDNTQTGSNEDPHAPETVKDYVREMATLDAVAAVTPQWDFTLLGEVAEPERVPGYYVSGPFLSMLGVEPVLGRLLTPEDDQPGSHAVGVIGYGLWQRRFGGDPEILGRGLVMPEGTAAIVGVLPPSFRWREDAEVWLPIIWNSYWATGRRVRLYELVGRMAPGVTVDQVQAEAGQLSARLAEEYPENLHGIGARVVPLLDDVVGPVRPALLILLGAAGLVLIIACANVASLLLVRGDARRREVAVRASLGAGRRRIAHELLAETVLLGLAGGLVGFLLAFGGVRALLPLLPAELPRRGEIEVDMAVLLFALGLATVTSLLFGLVPLIETFRSDPAGTLRDGGRGASAGRRRTRSVLVVAEVAVAVMIAVGATLLLRSFANLRHVDPGFETRGVITMQLSSLPADREVRIATMESLYERLHGTPGVIAAGEVSRVPLVGGNITSRFAIEGRTVPVEQEPEIDSRHASRDYFSAMSIPLLSGRMFEATDDAGAPPVALINEVAAARFFPGEDPIGRRISLGGSDWITIIGVVGGVRHLGLAEAPRPEAYVHSLQSGQSGPKLVVRTEADPRGVLPAIRAAIRETAPGALITEVTTMDEARDRALAGPRFNTLLFGLFAALAVLLAAIGAWGIMAFSVAQRRREFGIRMSVGARAIDIVRMVVSAGMRLAIAGILIGLAGAWAGGRLVSGLLFGVEPADPASLAGAALLLGTVVLGACLLTARRAIAADPVEALREG